jgi:hypothetical protein
MRHFSPLVWFVALVALLAVSFRPAMAASTFDVQRFSVGAGIAYDWYGGQPTVPYSVKSELCADGFLAYDISTAFALTAAGVYGTATKAVTVYPGVHYRLDVGGEDFAIAAAYAFYSGAEIPTPANEWTATVIYQHPLGKYAQGTVSETWGFDTKLARTSVQISFPLFIGKDKP